MWSACIVDITARNGTALHFVVELCHFSLCAISYKRHQIKSCRAALIIRFLATKTKIHILGTHPEGVTLSKVS